MFFFFCKLNFLNTSVQKVPYRTKFQQYGRFQEISSDHSIGLFWAHRRITSKEQNKIQNLKFSGMGYDIFSPPWGFRQNFQYRSFFSIDNAFFEILNEHEILLGNPQCMFLALSGKSFEPFSGNLIRRDQFDLMFNNPDRPCKWTWIK